MEAAVPICWWYTFYHLARSPKAFIALHERKVPAPTRPPNIWDCSLVVQHEACDYSPWISIIQLLVPRAHFLSCLQPPVAAFISVFLKPRHKETYNLSLWWQFQGFSWQHGAKWLGLTNESHTCISLRLRKHCTGQRETLVVAVQCRTACGLVLALAGCMQLPTYWARLSEPGKVSWKPWGGQQTMSADAYMSSFTVHSHTESNMAEKQQATRKSKRCFQHLHFPLTSKIMQLFLTMGAKYK